MMFCWLFDINNGEIVVSGFLGHVEHYWHRTRYLGGSYVQDGRQDLMPVIVFRERVAGHCAVREDGSEAATFPASISIAK